MKRQAMQARGAEVFQPEMTPPLLGTCADQAGAHARETALVPRGCPEDAGMSAKRSWRAVLLAGAALCLSACATSVPTQFYTLSAPSGSEVSAPHTPAASGREAMGRESVGEATAMGAGADRVPGFGGTYQAGHAQPGLRFEFGSLLVPERLNRPNIVLHPALQADGSAVPLQILENHRWDGVFADALRDALLAELAARSAGSSGPAVKTQSLRLSLTVYRFDGAANGRLDTLLDWRVRRLGEVASDEALSLSCRFGQMRQTRPNDVGALVGAMQQELQRLAADIVDGSRQWLATGKPECPGQMGQQPAEHRVPMVPAQPMQGGSRS